MITKACDRARRTIDPITMAKSAAITQLQTGVALGLTLGTALGGIGIVTIGWKAFFVATAVVCFAMAWFIRNMPNPVPGDERLPLGLAYRTVFSNPWAVLLFVLVFCEAGILLGTFSLVPASLETSGYTPTVAGLVTGSYGVAVLLTSVLVRRATQSVPPHHFIFYGGVAAILGLAVVAFVLNEATAVISVLLQGASWVLMHTTLQTWVTAVTPRARATSVSLFAAFMFLGNGAGVYVASHLLADRGTSFLFGLAAVLMIAFTAVAVISQRRHYLSHD